MKILQQRFVCLAVCAAFLFGSGIRTGFAAPRNPAIPQKSGAAVDLNSASEKELEDLPGVGAATAKKIISGRPYSSVDGLAKAGVSAATVKKITPLVTVSGGGAAASMPAPSKAPSKRSSAASTKDAAAAAPSGAAVDLNSASEKDLEDLPGVGPATAKKIIAGRPYSSVDGLAKAGVSAATVKKISPLVTVSGGAAASMPAPASAPGKKSSSAASTKDMAPSASGGAVDLNSASEKDLVDLPGVGPATAKKIIAGRPYSSVDGLAKAGVSAATIKKITPLVSVSGGGAAASMPAPAPAPSKKSSSSAASAGDAAPAAPASMPSKSAASTASQGTPGPGMVWVNLDSGIYHYPGTRYYGKTKSGKYLSESDAVKAGYHAAENEKKPQ